ncbi:SecY-interacting protein [Alteromonas facilis]|uniref:SecY-interacting protein n=1 Tax=Alteromonas facilis TaxID=2048004 RepID=UPI000C293D54|nr:SecY-interacting protein [Alteromonas facilis]
MIQNIDHAMDEFVQGYISAGALTPIEFDSEWLSPCVQVSANDGDYVDWKPVLQNGLCQFGDMEKALELTLDEQFKAFFCRYFSDHLEASSEHGNLTLLQVWNVDDFERLQQNLIGHVLMKRQLKQAETLFFALTDEEDFIISVDNASGRVVLEQVGKEPSKVLAENVAEFIASLRPLTR